MINQKPRSPLSPVALRRRVRRITAACVGAAALAAAALTVNLAWAADDPAAASSSATTDVPTGTTDSSASTAAPPLRGEADDDQAPVARPGITVPPSTAQAPSSTQLLAPQQAPLVGGSGRSHTQSGGS